MGDQEHGTDADGRIEAASDGVIVGWAYRPGSAEPVEVEILIDGRPVGRIVAREKRGSLRREGIGNGKHGFRFALEEMLSPGHHQIVVRVLPEAVALPPVTEFDGRPATGEWEGIELSPYARHPLAVDIVPGASPPSMLVVDRITADGVAGSAPRGADVSALVAGAVVARATASEGGRFSLRLPEHGDGPLTIVGPDGIDALAAVPLGRAGDSPRPVPPLALLDEGAGSLPPVLVGRDDWLFDWWGRDPVANDQITAAAHELDAVSSTLASTLIPYLAVLVPSRATLEAHRLPRGLERSKVAERFLAAARACGHLDVLDLSAPLKDAREHGEATQRTSDALTERAAFDAARAVVKRLRAMQVAIAHADEIRFSVGEPSTLRGDLSGRRKDVLRRGELVALPARRIPAALLVETVDLPAWDVLRGRRVPIGPPLLAEGRRATAFACEGGRGRVVVVGSEVDPALLRWLAEASERLTWIAEDEVDLRAIELDAPDCVVQVVREQRLGVAGPE